MNGNISTLIVKGERLQSIDMLRGIIMVIMTLDHVRDYFTASTFDPVDLTQTYPALFLTRWITHYCAPNFIFLAGISAYLYGEKVKDKKQLAIFLLTRGLWLVFLEFTLVRLGWFYNFDYDITIAQVIWAIGWVMVLLSLLIFLDASKVAFLGLIIIIFHNLLDPLTPEMFGSFYWFWHILHDPGNINLTENSSLFIGYPIFPWLGVISAGYGFGQVFLLESQRRIVILKRTGLSLILLFLVVRGMNFYGDNSPWTIQGDFLFTIFSFLNCTKYPPSLAYLLMTIGPALLLMSYLEQWKGKIFDFFHHIGKVPMFFYILHIFLIHFLAIINYGIRGGDISLLFSSQFFWQHNGEYGYDLPGIYLVWVLVVVLLYPLCVWYGNFKRKHKKWQWLSYL